MHTDNALSSRALCYFPNTTYKLLIKKNNNNSLKGHKATIKALTKTAQRAIAKQFQSWYRVRLTLNTFILFKHHLLASTMYWILFCHYKQHIESRVANNQTFHLIRGLSVIGSIFITNTFANSPATESCVMT